MRKRIFSLLMALIMAFSSLPLTAFAAEEESGERIYQLGESVWVRGEENDPQGICAEGTFWIPDYDENEQPVTRQGLCEMAEHVHSFVCPADCGLAHLHGEGCYTDEYTCTIHSHDENCVTETRYDCGLEEHLSHDGCTASEVCTIEEHDHAALGCPVETVYLCETEEEHDHAEAACPSESHYSCGVDAHIHAEGACNLVTVYDCGKELHSHESCAASTVYPGCVEHLAHDENCPTESRLSCGREEHVCITDGCAADCPIPEHSHSADCDMDATYYRWTVVEDTSADLALSNDQGLPVHFFIAAPGHAIDPNGTYYDYKTSLWGKRNGSGGIYAYAGTEDEPDIPTQKGIRNVNDETLVTKYIKNMPADMKDFSGQSNMSQYDPDEYEIKWVTICWRPGIQEWGNPMSCRCGVNYEHIHIDGVLSKKVAPAELKLSKKLVDDNGNEVDAEVQESFQFKLTRLQQDAAGNPTNVVDTSFGTGGSITLNSIIPVGSSTADIKGADNTEVGYGFYKLEELPSNTRWQNSGTDVVYNNRTTRYNAGPVYIRIAPNGTLNYSDTYNGVYSQANDIVVKNSRRPYQVTYSWEGIPDGIVELPAGRTDIKPGGSININQSYTNGLHALGNDGKYYVFQGWQYYDTNGQRHYIQYNGGATPTPGTITNIQDNVNIHGLWTEYQMAKAAGHIEINKSFANKPTDADMSALYFKVYYGQDMAISTEISAKNAGTWSADGTSWSYEFPISDDGLYTVVEGKYNIAGYNTTTVTAVEPVSGISSDEGTYESEDPFVANGYAFYEVGHRLNVTMPFDTSVVYGAAAQTEALGIHAATVNFTNSYAKRSAAAVHEYPSFQLRKMNGDYTALIEGATFTLTAPDGTETSLTTDAGGTVNVSELKPGVYTLRESSVPAGYIMDALGYKITVSANAPREELRPVCDVNAEDHPTTGHVNACYSYVELYSYKVTVTDENGLSIMDVQAADPLAHESPSRAVYNSAQNRLNVPNNQIKTDLVATKSLVYEDGSPIPEEAIPANATVRLHVYNYDAATQTVGAQFGDTLILNAANGWTAEINDLPYGDYFVEESLASLHGFTHLGVSFNGNSTTIVGSRGGYVVNVRDTEKITVSVENRYKVWEAADFTLMKTDAANAHIPGAMFQLLDGDTNVTKEHIDTARYAYDETAQAAVTDANGHINFIDFKLDAGETSKDYTLVEVKSANGYYRSEDRYTVTVSVINGTYDISINSSAWDGDDDTLTVTNTPIMGRIEVAKSFDGDKVPADTTVIFRVSGVDNNLSYSATVGAAEDYKHVFDNLPLGQYEVIERCDVPGYSYSASYSVNGGASQSGSTATVTLSDNSGGVLTVGSLPKGASASVEFTNEYTRNERVIVEPSSFAVIKVDESGSGLADATFTLYNDAACTDPVATSEVPEGFTLSATSDKDGFARFTGLKLEGKASAEFYLKESQAPENYIASNTVWKISLSEDKIKVDELNPDDNIFETIIKWFITYTNPAQPIVNDEGWTSNGVIPQLKVMNRRIKGELTVNKVYDGVAAEDLSSATVEMHVHGPIIRDANNVITGIGPQVGTIKLDGSKVTQTISNLEVGEYVLRETFADVHSHTWNGVTYSAATVEFGGNTFARFEVNAENTSHTITVTNSYTEWTAADFSIYKYSDYSEDHNEVGKISKPLPGAVFGLFTDENCTVPLEDDENNVVTATTDISGYLRFEGLEVPSGKTQMIYYLKELTAPENHRPVNTVWTVTVSVDKGKYSLDITAPAGTTGWYWLGTPGNENSSSVTDLLAVKNDPVLGTINVSKTFANSLIPAGLSSIEVALFNSAGSRVGTITLPDAETGLWQGRFTNLPMGTYYLMEQRANVPGYTLSTKYYVDDQLQGAETNPTGYATITLSPGANAASPSVAVKVSNSYAKQTKLVILPASLTIEKRDSETGALLPGAKFKLLDNNNNVVANPNSTDNLWTTGADGRVTVDKLYLTEEQQERYAEYLDGVKTTPALYTLSEAEAPAGYVRDDTQWEVRLSETGVQIDKLDPNTNIFTTIIQTILGWKDNSDSGENYSNGVLTVENAPIKGSLSITKSHAFTDADGIAIEAPGSLSGMSTIIHAHGPFESVENLTEAAFDAAAEHKITLTDGQTSGTISELPLGYYLVHEAFSSFHGYEWEDGGEFAGKTADETILMPHDGMNIPYYVYQVKEDGNDSSAPVAVNITNTYKQWDKADFWVHKVDGAAVHLAGAQFQLFDGDNNVTETYIDKTISSYDESAKAAVSNAGGMVHFHNFTVAKGETKTFILKELKAPTGYVKTESTWEITVSHDDDGYELKINGQVDQDDTIELVNQPMKAKLHIVKAFSGDELYGLTSAEPVDISKLDIDVAVKYPDGSEKTHKLVWDGEKLALTLENLSLGSYTVREQGNTSITGYDFLGASYTVAAGDAAAVAGNSVTFLDAETDITEATITITNSYDRNEKVINNPDSFTILKTDETGKPLSGAVFRLSNNYDTHHIREFTTGADGKVVVDELIGEGTLSAHRPRAGRGQSLDH